MTKSYHPHYPPLRRRIVQRFLGVVSLYAVFGILMILAVSLASGLTPKLIHLNYDSISYSREMRTAWTALYYHEGPTPNGWTQSFDQALGAEEHNITEPGEAKIAADIRSLWNNSKTNPDHISKDDYLRMNRDLNLLVDLNERGMFRIAEQSSTLAHNVYLGGIAFLIVTLLISIVVSDGIANRLALPLKKIAEVLKNRPSLSGKLKLPPPTSLELKILNHELTQLWNRLQYLNELNVEKVENQKNQLTTILTFVEDAILVLDSQGNVLHCNPGFSDLLTILTEDIIGKPWADLSSTSPNYIYLRDVLAATLQQHQTIEILKSGQKRALSIRSRTIENDKKQPIGTLYLLHDVTERRQTEKLKREFIGVLSHELKTPLQSLSICADVLGNYKSSLDQNGQLLVDTINEDVSRIRAVATDFIQVGVEDLRSLKLKFEKVNLDDLIPEWLKPFIVLAGDKKIKINFSSQKSGRHIVTRMDKVKFPWVVSNLLANAIRVSPQNSQIDVNLKETQQNILIEIADQGPGVAPEIQKRMFEPYFQGGSYESGVNSGFLGIGLTIAKEVVEAHNGAIRYEPNIPKGARFIVTLTKDFSVEGIDQ